MSGKITEYTNEALTINNNDWFDISVLISTSPNVYESRKLKGSTINSLIGGGINLSTQDLFQAAENRVYSAEGRNLTFNNINEYETNSNKESRHIAADHTFVGLSTFNTGLRSLGRLQKNVTIVNTSPFVPTLGQNILLVDTSADEIIINLPDISGINGFEYIIIDINGVSETNKITVNGFTDQLINGAASVELKNNFGWLKLYSHSGNWAMRKDCCASGWASYYNNGYAATAGLTVVADTDTVLTPINTSPSPVIDETQLPNDYTHLYDGDKILGKEGDSLSIQVFFNAIPVINAQWCDFWLDMGGATGEQFRQTFDFPKGLATEKNIMFTVPSVNVNADWEANGASLNIRTNDTLSVRDFNVIVTRTHKAK